MSDRPADDFDLSRLELRLARDEDHQAIRELYRAGLLEGQLQDNDTGADIDDLHSGYFSDEGASGFWVATLDDQIIGMIGVQKTGEHVAEIRRLRVREGYRRHHIGTRLVETALAFCRRHAYLKVILDIRAERSPAIAMADKFGFTLARTRESGGWKTLDLYLDLYSEPGT
ncbi:MAG: GNAT family N-acetyltransferase [Phycisphaerales bacterium]|nr:MAG: GNAT family N-acetyltransferase [Phycisphaerales bacterium]